MTTEHGFSLKSGFMKILCTLNIPLQHFCTHKFEEILLYDCDGDGEVMVMAMVMLKVMVMNRIFTKIFINWYLFVIGANSTLRG